MPAIKPPNKIRLGSKFFPVEFVKGLISSVDDKAVWGTYNGREGNIKIEATLDDEQRLETLLHEIIHGLNDHYDLYDYSNTEQMALEEKRTTLLARGLISFLRDNKAFTNYTLKVFEKQ